MFGFLIGTTLLFTGHPVKVQTILSSPVVGAVSDTSIQLFWFCLPDSQFFIHFEGSGYDFYDTVQCNSDSTLKWQSPKLLPNTKHNITVLHNLDTIKHLSIRTFPHGDTAHVKIAFGSCLEITDSVFLAVKDHSPHVFLFLGDWGYPDRGYPLQDTVYFADSFHLVKQSWINRYNSFPLQDKAFSTVPVDYIWDDHDYVATDASRNYVAYYTNGINLYARLIPIDSQTRQNSIRGYKQFFPHYPLPNPDAIYHSFVLGPVRVIMLDTRSTKQHHLFAFSKSGGVWQYDTTLRLMMIDSVQWQWLRKELTTAREPWVIIASSVVFSQHFTRFITDLLGWQVFIGDSVVLLSMILADQWAGYRHQAKKLLALLDSLNRLNSTIIISGDIHTSGIDTSRRGGLYEVVAGNLGQWNSRIARRLDSTLGMRPWDIVQGVDNDNFLPAFGLIEAWGSDSLKMCIIDMRNTVIGCHTIHSSFKTVYVQQPSQSSPNNKEIICNDTECLIRTNQKWHIVEITYDGKVINQISGSGNYLFRRNCPNCIIEFKTTTHTITIR